MSLGVYIDCDLCSDVLTAGPVGSGAVIREDARREGWHVGLQGGFDICSDCWGKGRRLDDVVAERGSSVPKEES